MIVIVPGTVRNVWDQLVCNTVYACAGMRQQLANDPEMQGLNPWAMVLRTFMPWVNAGAAPDYTQEDTPEGAAASTAANDANPPHANESEDELD